MSLINEWQIRLKALRESPFPEYEEPPVQNTIGGMNQPTKDDTQAPIPVIDVNDEQNHCNIDFDALSEILTWAGADQTEVSKVIDKLKVVSKQVGVVKLDNLDGVLVQDNRDDSTALAQVIPVNPTGLANGRQVVYNENLEKVMNNEEVQIIKSKKEE
jgi:hypothetical protein